MVHKSTIPLNSSGVVTSISGTANQIVVTPNVGDAVVSISPTLILPGTLTTSHNVQLSALTASQALVLDGSSNVTTLAYTSSNTASTLVSRDGSGNIAVGQLKCATFEMTTSPTNNYVMTSDGSGNGTWQAVSASGAVTSLAGDSGSATPSSGAITVSGGTTGLTISGSSHTLSLTGTLKVVNGGTGQTTYTDGQLLIGDSSSSGLDKATLTAGPNISITNGHGTITIAVSGAPTNYITNDVFAYTYFGGV